MTTNESWRDVCLPSEDVTNDGTFFFYFHWITRIVRKFFFVDQCYNLKIFFLVPLPWWIFFEQQQKSFNIFLVNFFFFLIDLVKFFFPVSSLNLEFLREKKTLWDYVDGNKKNVTKKTDQKGSFVEWIQGEKNNQNFNCISIKILSIIGGHHRLYLHKQTNQCQPMCSFDYVFFLKYFKFRLSFGKMDRKKSIKKRRKENNRDQPISLTSVRFRVWIWIQY